MIGSLLRLPHQAVVRHTAARLAERFPELRQAHMAVFQHIEHPPAGSRLTDLAEMSGIAKQSMGELVDHLAAGGYVERIPDPTDGRAKLIRLTDRGWAVHEAAFDVVEELQATWAARIGDADLRELMRILERLIDELDLGAGTHG